MSSLSTFGAFTTARLGIYASQKALDVVGNNISNINTTGYTRQTLDQVSFFTGAADRYANGLDTRVGNGTLVTGVSQLRDPYLDIRYRTEMSTVGYLDAMLDGMNQLSNILDEVAKGEDADGELGVLEKQFNDLIEQMEQLSSQGIGEDSFDTNVRTSAAALTKLFNSYASQLEELRQTQESALTEDVANVNNILTSIRELNASIRKSNIYGGDALEQKDLRNQLIDQLAEYVRIDVTYEEENLGAGLKVEKLVIRLNSEDGQNADTDGTVLVDGIYAAQLSIGDREDDYAVTVSALRDQYGRAMESLVNGEKVTSTPVELSDNSLYGALQAERELLTEQGEFATAEQLAEDPNANTKRGIPYYQKALDVLANQFASVMNEANELEADYIKDAGDSDAGDIRYDDIFKLADGSLVQLEVEEKDGNLYFQAQGSCALKAGVTTGMTDAQAQEYGYDTVEKLNEALADDPDLLLKVPESGIMTSLQKTHLFPQTGDAETGLQHGVYKEVETTSGPLFSNHGSGDDATGITAANISISKSWAEGTVRIQQSKDPDHTSTDNTNLLHILNLLMGEDTEFKTAGSGDLNGTDNFQDGTPANGGVFFTGTFQEMFTEYICGTLAADRQSTSTLLDNHATSADELYVDRDAVSGVDLNDEAMNMMQYQKSLNAAYRYMTVIDEALERLIENTGVAGR